MPLPFLPSVLRRNALPSVAVVVGIVGMFVAAIVVGDHAPPLTFPQAASGASPASNTNTPATIPIDAVVPTLAPPLVPLKPEADPLPDVAKIFRLVDRNGDTIPQLVECKVGKQFSMRVAGVPTPEDADASTLAVVKWVCVPLTDDFDGFPLSYRGYAADFTSDIPRSFDFTITRNNDDPLGPPLVYSVRVTFVAGPQPPPVVVPDVPDVPKPVEPKPTTVTAVTYVYEKNDTAVPVGVRTALNRLNRERQIIATEFEQNTFDGNDEIPEQYKAALAKAKEVGLPALIVLAGAVVVNTVKAPTTEAAVMEAVQ